MECSRPKLPCIDTSHPALEVLNLGPFTSDFSFVDGPSWTKFLCTNLVQHGNDLRGNDRQTTILQETLLAPEARKHDSTKNNPEWNSFQDPKEQPSNFPTYFFLSRSWIISISQKHVLCTESFRKPHDSSCVSTITKAFFPSPRRKQVSATKVAESHMGKIVRRKSVMLWHRHPEELSGKWRRDCRNKKTNNLNNLNQITDSKSDFPPLHPRKKQYTQYPLVNQ